MKISTGRYASREWKGEKTFYDNKVNSSRREMRTMGKRGVMLSFQNERERKDL